MTQYTAAQRRQAIARLLEGAQAPVSAAALGERFSVSRQIVVGDIALLRAAGTDIAATPRGYVYLRAPAAGVERKLACVHAPEDMGRELELMVDNGCTVLDVIVEHPVYGQLTGQLHLSSRYDVGQFLQKVSRSGARPLSALTGGVHLHTILCPDEAAWHRVRAALDQAGFLYTGP